MKIAYVDCFSGVAGDMLLAGLIDAGCPLEELQGVVARLNLPGVTLSAENVKRGGIAAVHVRVVVPPEARKKHRHLPQIVKIIDEAGLSPSVAAQATAIFQNLAEAESRVHQTTPEKVHFHEVGAADAIVDIVCACAALDVLGVERVEASAVPTGHGTVVCEHGVMPVPAPATAILLEGVPLAPTEEPGELTTPTGAAVLKTLAARFGPPPAMTIRRAGYGAGTREGQTRPNFLRVLLGEVAGTSTEHTDAVTVLEAQIDDSTGQAIGHAAERLLQAGALDVYLTPIMMKKGRPGQLITVLCTAQSVRQMEALLFRETSTFGVRRYETLRSKLRREFVTVQTRFGEVRLKLGWHGKELARAWPEYDDCAAAAAQHGAALRVVQEEALRTWQRSLEH